MAKEEKFTTITSITVNTEIGIKRYESHTDIATITPFSDLKCVVKHSAVTMPGKVEIIFLNYITQTKNASYKQLSADLQSTGYRAATIQELCSVQDGVKGIKTKKLFCFGTEVNIEGFPGQTPHATYEVTISDKSDVRLYNASDTMLEPGFIIAAVKLIK